MVDTSTIEDRVKNSMGEPRLIPKAYAHIAVGKLPTAFLKQAEPWIPIPALETICGSIESTFDHDATVGLTCDRVGQNHLNALRYELEGEHGLSILTIEGEPVAVFKHGQHGQPNILSFRYVGNQDSPTHPLIPGGIYTAPSEVRNAAERTTKRSPFLAIDGAKLYPETMFFEHTNPTTARRKYVIAEHAFMKIVENSRQKPRQQWFSPRTARPSRYTD